MGSMMRHIQRLKHSAWAYPWVWGLTFNSRLGPSWAGKYFSWGSGRVEAYCCATRTTRRRSCSAGINRWEEKINAVCLMCPQCQTVVTKSIFLSPSLPSTPPLTPGREPLPPPNPPWGFWIYMENRRNGLIWSFIKKTQLLLQQGQHWR